MTTGGGAPATAATPHWRNPFVIAFVIGVVTLTILRPRLRYIPEAPADLGAFPGDAFSDGSGAPWDPGVSVVTFTTREGGDCGGLELAEKVWRAFLQSGVRIAVRAIVIDAPAESKALARAAHRAGGDRAGLTFVGARDAARLEAARSALESALAGAPPTADEERRGAAVRPDCAGPELLRWATIVDARGRLRGRFSTGWTDVRSELFHRAQHVRDATPDPPTP